ncbi:MAG: M28 family metallopeptidase [Desulfitobacteriaceae bacterium]|nr:M28 family metallopeptidase [Desulfitobacteriaceae bacterium]MDI6912826.1 M28 family metallopeptidase [Desulfitobacteriaceae bacterium]
MRFFFLKRGLVALCLALLVVFLVHSPAQVSASALSLFSAEKAYEHVKYLVQKVGPRPAGSKAELKAAQYIYYTLERAGWKVHEQSFSKVVVHDPPLQLGDQKIELVNSQNIVAELPGKKADTIILGAHYDTADVNAPGALDNASGVGVLLELARVLAADPHEESYQLVLFGAEEQGLVGSAYYAAHSDLSAVSWMLNLDMIGTPMEIDVAGKKSAPPELTQRLTALARKSGIPFHLSREAMVMSRDSTQGGNSDFSSFLDQGIPAAGLGLAGRPPGFYHRPEDRLERVSLEELQKVGEFVSLLVGTVRLEQVGPRTWDEFYLTFQFGSQVFFLPSSALRALYLLVFLLVGIAAVRSLRQGVSWTWKGYLALSGVVFVICLGAIALSGVGEILWQMAKQRQFIWYAYPELFVLVRIVIVAGFLLYLGSWFPKLPLPKEPRIYWLSGVIVLFCASLLSALIRIDLAFPFVFWLFCFAIQRTFPNLILALIGPYFFYRFHWEMLQSNQWLSYYEVVHRYYPLFIAIYALMAIPLLLALLHVASFKPRFWQRWLQKARLPALGAIALSLLALGLIPSYTSRYPQGMTVREEWTGEAQNQLHLFSRDNFPSQLIRELQAKPGKSLILPSLSDTPPVSVKAEVMEKQNVPQRALELVLQFQFSRDPYLVRLTLESSRPFKISGIDEFLPSNKLPRKVQLLGKRQNQGNYVLVVERTPPQRNQIKLSLEAESTLQCTVEVNFPDPEQNYRIKANALSVDYQASYQKVIEF